RRLPHGVGSPGLGAARGPDRHRADGRCRADRAEPAMTATDPAKATTDATMTSDEILVARRDLLGPSLSLSYRTPLHIVRGEGAHLYDADGRAYLDCVNNVAHVGHA